MSLLDNPPHLVTIERPTYVRTPNDVGNVQTSTVVATAVPAWVQNASSSEIIEYQKRDQTITDRVNFFTLPDLQPGDNITVTAGPSRVGDQFEFKALSERTAGFGLAWKAMCEINRT